MSANYISYSACNTITITKLCANKCGYCDFQSAKKEHLPSKKIVLSKITKAIKNDASSLKLISGERIAHHPSIIENVKYYGLNNFTDYVKMIIESIAEAEAEIKLLTSLDLGIFSLSELVFLREWIFALNLSLESLDENMMREVPHRDSPYKKPEIRKIAIIDAGKAKIPTTVSIMTGIGEKPYYRYKALELISELHEKYKHIQSIELKRFLPLPNTLMETSKTISDKNYINFVKNVKEHIDKSIKIQVPLKGNEHIIDELLEAGINDLGEIDFSENRKTPVIQKLMSQSELLNSNKYKLRERLPVYDSFILKGWFPERFMKPVKHFFKKKLVEPDFAKKINKCIITKTSEKQE